MNSEKLLNFLPSYLKDEDIDKKLNFLLEVIKVMSIEGINKASCEQVSNNLFEHRLYYKLLFIGGIEEMLEFFEEYCNALMLCKLSEHYNLDEKVSVREKIYQALCFRIIDNDINKAFLRLLFKYYSAPKLVANSMKYAYKTSDLIWNFAGDRSIDYNFYTKRGLLTSVYIASMINYINSGDDEKTKNFIKKSLENIVNIGKLKSKIKGSLDNIAEMPFFRLFM